MSDDDMAKALLQAKIALAGSVQTIAKAAPGTNMSLEDQATYFDRQKKTVEAESVDRPGQRKKVELPMSREEVIERDHARALADLDAIDLLSGGTSPLGNAKKPSTGKPFRER